MIHDKQIYKFIINMTLFKKVVVLFTLFSVLFGDIKVINKSTPK